jgi:hypothetical protein
MNHSGAWIGMLFLRSSQIVFAFYHEFYVRSINRPEKEGPIDLAVQDLPHDSSNTEWWYLNSHLKTADGRELSIFVAFFRMYVSVSKHIWVRTQLITYNTFFFFLLSAFCSIRSYDTVTEEGEFAHTLLFAVSDPANDRYLPTGYVDPDCCALVCGYFPQALAPAESPPTHSFRAPS